MSEKLFPNFPDDAAVWVYQADRHLAGSEVELIKNRLQSFIQNWTAHNIKVVAESAVLNNLFVIIIVNQHRCDLSGCGIDKSVAEMKTIGQSLGIDFFNRLNVAVMLADNSIVLFHAGEINEQFDSGKITPESLVFNNTVNTKEGLLNNWKIPFSQSWVAKAIA